MNAVINRAKVRHPFDICNSYFLSYVQNGLLFQNKSCFRLLNGLGFIKPIHCIMNSYQIPFSDLPMLAKTDKAYAEQVLDLKPFFKYPVDIQHFIQIISDKSKEALNRTVLVESLRKQYQKLLNPALGSQNIEKLLQNNTFTVTTAHQPSLLTGPLYFVYKIFSTIRLSEILKEKYPNFHFVPVFVIGGEDHDFEEVNFAKIFNKKLVWEAGEKGSVGMMQTQNLKIVLEELKEILGNNEHAQTIFKIIENAYTQFDVYQDATQNLLNELFGKYGLVVLNMNDVDLKRLFIPIMRRELVEQRSKHLVEATQTKLEKAGFKAQAFARPINLFYLRDQLRERIVEINGVYSALNTDFTWTQETILAELEANPQHFSPNVILRPLYQETVLPNLAYIGGGGELAYWLERKSQFKHFGLNFPMLIRRNSVLWLDKLGQERLEKLNIQLTDLTGDIDVFIKKYITNSTNDLINLQAEKEQFSQIFATIAEKAKWIDPTLEKTVLAEQTKQLQVLVNIEAKLLKSEKQKQETTIQQIRTLAQKYFPNGGLQERTDNFLPFYVKHGADFFEVLKQKLNPLEQGMIVIQE
jgi:bacillithiol synthase